jgi:hypothetical protein
MPFISYDPDSYVAIVDREGHAEALTSYFDTHQITPTGSERSEPQSADTPIRKKTSSGRLILGSEAGSKLSRIVD